MTALTASFSSVACRHSGGMAPSERAPSRPPSIAATRSGVGATIGSPSDHWRELNSVRSRSDRRRACRRRPDCCSGVREAGRLGTWVACSREGGSDTRDFGRGARDRRSSGSRSAIRLESCSTAWWARRATASGRSPPRGWSMTSSGRPAGAERAQLTDGESLERGGRDESGGRAGLGQLDGVVETPRRARPSVGGAGEDDVAVLAHARRSARAAPAWRRWPCAGGRWSCTPCRSRSSSPIPPVSRSKFDLVLSRKPIVRPVQSSGSGGTTTDSVVMDADRTQDADAGHACLPFVSGLPTRSAASTSPPSTIASILQTDSMVIALDLGTSSARATLYDQPAGAIPGRFHQVTYAPTADARRRRRARPRACCSTRWSTCLDAITRASRSDDIQAVGVTTFWHGLLGFDAARPPGHARSSRGPTRAARATPRCCARALDDDGAPRAHRLPSALLVLAGQAPLARPRAPRRGPARRLAGDRSASTSSSRSSARRRRACRWPRAPGSSIRTRCAGIRRRWRPPASSQIGSLPAGRTAPGAAACARRGRPLASAAERAGFPPWATARPATSARTASIPTRDRAQRGHVGRDPRGDRAIAPAPPADSGATGSIGSGTSSEARRRRAATSSRGAARCCACAATTRSSRPRRGARPTRTASRVLPFLAGERSPGWRGERRGVIGGLSLDTTAVEIVRAALEAVALRLALVYGLLAPWPPRDHTVVASGGALGRSRAWTQIIADAPRPPDRWSRSRRRRVAEPHCSLSRHSASCRISRPPGRRSARRSQPDPAHHARYRDALERQRRWTKGYDLDHARTRP